MNFKKCYLLILVFAVLILSNCSSNSNNLNLARNVIPRDTKLYSYGHWSHVHLNAAFNNNSAISQYFFLNSTIVLDKSNNSEVLLGIHPNYPDNNVSRSPDSYSLLTWVLNINSKKWNLVNPLDSPQINKYPKCEVDNCSLSNGNVIAFDSGNSMIIYPDCGSNNTLSTWGWNGVSWDQLGSQSSDIFNNCNIYGNGYMNMNLFSYKNTVAMIASNDGRKIKTRFGYELVYNSTIWVYSNTSNSWSILTTLQNTPFPRSVSYLPSQSEVVVVCPHFFRNGFDTLIFENHEWKSYDYVGIYPPKVTQTQNALSYTGSKCGKLIYVANDAEFKPAGSNLSNLKTLTYVWNYGNWKLINSTNQQFQGAMSELPTQNGILIQSVNYNGYYNAWKFTC